MIYLYLYLASTIAFGLGGIFGTLMCDGKEIIEEFFHLDFQSRCIGFVDTMFWCVFISLLWPIFFIGCVIACVKDFLTCGNK